MANEPEDPTTHALERKLATILSADVAEYSRLMAEDEEQTLRTFRTHKQVFDSLVAMHRGRIFNTAGDAILAEFGSAVEAVRCATEIQAALRTRNDQLPPSRQVRFRIGINLGDVMVHGHDLLGDGVNVAARLQGAAEPGGICLSGSVYDQIRNKLSLSFISLGEKTFKNIPQPVRTFSITEAEGHGALPAPKLSGRGAGSRGVKWAAAAALLLIGAGGSWVYLQHERGRAEQARVREETARQEAAQREARLTAERLAAEEAQRRANVERQALEAARRDIQTAAQRAAEGGKTQTARVIAGATSPPRVPAPVRPSTAATVDGLYAGPVCSALGPNDARGCTRRQATVADRKISAQWPGRGPGATMVVEGEVSAAGDVTIRMHTESAAGARGARADLTGTLRDGRLEATGSFRNGREVTINWRKN
jgi:adenylate cyclase